MSLSVTLVLIVAAVALNATSAKRVEGGTVLDEQDERQGEHG